MAKCFECGWFDNDKSFFYEREGEQYCSLHINKEEKASETN